MILSRPRFVPLTVWVASEEYRNAKQPVDDVAWSEVDVLEAMIEATAEAPAHAIADRRLDPGLDADAELRGRSRHVEER